MTTYALQSFNFEEEKFLGINIHGEKGRQEKVITEIIQNNVFWIRRWLEVQNGFWTMYNRLGGGVGRIQLTDVLENRIKEIWFDVKKNQGVGIENEVDIRGMISSMIGSLLTDLSWTKRNGIEKHGFQKMVNVIRRIHQDGLVF